MVRAAVQAVCGQCWPSFPSAESKLPVPRVREGAREVRVLRVGSAWGSREVRGPVPRVGSVASVR